MSVWLDQCNRIQVNTKAYTKEDIFGKPEVIFDKIIRYFLPKKYEVRKHFMLRSPVYINIHYQCWHYANLSITKTD